MKKLALMILTATLSTSAFAFKGYECENEEQNKAFSIRTINETSVSVQETVDGVVTLSIAALQRDVYSEEPLMAFAAIDLEDGRRLDVVESDAGAHGVILLQDYNLEIYDCETVK